jgi:hypothetical protein
VSHFCFHSQKNVKPKPGVVAHTCNSNIQETKAGGSRAQGQLGYIVRLCLTKIEKGGGERRERERERKISCHYM